MTNTPSIQFAKFIHSLSEKQRGRMAEDLLSQLAEVKGIQVNSSSIPQINQVAQMLSGWAGEIDFHEGGADW